MVTLCLGKTGTYEVAWTWQNDAPWGTHTGESQLWVGTPSCSATSAVAAGGIVTLPAGYRSTSYITLYYNSVFLNRFWSDTGSMTYRGQHCHAM